MTANRRKFTRIRFRAAARLELPDGRFEVEVVDLSLKGALVSPTGELFVTVGSHGRLEMQLDDVDTTIGMDVTVVHHGSNSVGLACREIDLDSVTHLRRLVELNIGDEAILQRELNALAQS